MIIITHHYSFSTKTTLITTKKPYHLEMLPFWGTRFAQLMPAPTYYLDTPKINKNQEVLLHYNAAPDVFVTFVLVCSKVPKKLVSPKQFLSRKNIIIITQDPETTLSPTHFSSQKPPLSPNNPFDFCLFKNKDPYH